MKRSVKSLFGGMLALLLLSSLFTATARPAEASTFTNWPVYKSGDSGENVWTIQYMLRQRGYSLSADGQFGTGTDGVVKQFQAAKGLTSDGVVGNNTWEALIVTSNLGSSGDAVRALQRQLNTRGYGITVDGSYGAGTDSAVRDYKTKNGLAADGGAGLTTWNKLVTGSGTGGGSRAQLAQTIINSGRATFWTRHDSGVVDNATANQNIRDTAAGKAALRSSYGTAPGGSVYLSINMLSGLNRIIQSYTVDISEFAGGSHSATSYHYKGTAVDIARINGSGVSSSNPYYRGLMQLCRDLGAVEVLGPGDANHDTHVHCAWSS
jgi:zinc D-Ala-D-Ala carboxypeptidase